MHSDIENLVNEHITSYLNIGLCNIDREIVDHTTTLITHGRKFRALLLMYTAEAFGSRDYSKMSKLAARLEIMHRASLIHDDLVDGDEYRDGIPTLHTKFNHCTAIYIPVLLREIVDEGLVRGGAYLHTCMRQAYADLATGQMFELTLAESKEAKFSDYQEVVYYKSAGFARFAFQAGYFLGQGEYDSNTQTLAATAAYLFQMVDDIQDMVSTGIPSDLKNNIKSAPWFFMQKDMQQTEDPQKLLEAMRAPETLQKVYAHAESLLKKFKQELTHWMPANDSRTFLIQAAEKRFRGRTASFRESYGIDDT